MEYYHRSLYSNMALWEVILLAVALAMDAFSAAICKGLTLQKMDYKKALLVGLYFGVFQGLMPLIGYFVGSAFSIYIESIDHWIAFGLLVFIGINMIKESFSTEEHDGDFSFKALIVLAIATSIDALTVGVSFSVTKPIIGIYFSVLIIGVVTFILSTLGVKIGNVFGSRFKQPAEITGGVILILIGIKILLEHLGVISF